ncbi:tetratricopeptide repeat protein [Nostoc sp.]|uniref:tetratricopeptide repeat protein n=1 Tax=Nostoc sp. TaxID=1180 RepID=UPI002FFBBA69
MQTLHLHLKPVNENYIELRYFIDNPNKYEKRSLPLSEITDLIQLAERDYYVADLPEDYTVTGRRLYDWLDGSDRWLQGLLDKYRHEGIVLGIAAAEKLAHLPWEVLHDGVNFLVQRVPAIVPVRWVSDSTVKKLTIDGETENRALQVLFMATSPLDVKPVLDFEGEEARILEATKRQPLALTVEESGCLLELGYLVDGYDRDYFDVLHLTGHATFQDGQPRFITETEIGEAFYASASDIAQELQFRLPKLIFLSGCRTGQAGNSGSVPSMAEELLKSGAKAVLGWGQKVLDPDATAAAAALYEELSAGKQITEALACTDQTLIKNKARDWHLLRLYAAGNLPSSLVTPLRTRGRKPAPPLSVSTQFLDPAGKVKVPTRESFIGRRRQLQNCLRVLSQTFLSHPYQAGDTEGVGVLIHGMGGLGKSSLAARLCDRLPNFERVVWVGHIDEASLVSRLAEKLDDNEQRKSLQNDDEELRFRLRRVFCQLHEEAKPFLLVLDDFEGNLEPRNESYVLQPEAAEVMKALVWAIRENSTSHRIIITCRYDFEFTQLQYFHKQPLDALQGTDLQKKCDRLTAFSAKSQVNEALKSQAQKLADGNPRLLEWLDKILQNTTVDVAAILNRLAADQVELREQVLAEALLQQMDSTMREMLSRGLVFELPVPRAALAAVCDTIAKLEDYISRAVALGLLEVSHDEALRVPRILPVQLENGEALYKQAAEVLYRLWWETNIATEEQCLEIHRLALQGKVDKIAVEVVIALTARWHNVSRFREAVEICCVTLKICENYHILHNLAMSERELGLIKQALKHSQKVLAVCPSEDKIQKAATLHQLGTLKVSSGEIEQAIILYEQSLAIKEEIGDVYGKAATLNNLGILKVSSGEIEQAIALFEQSLAIKEEIGDVYGKGTTLNNLGHIKASSGEIEQAIALFEQSLALTEKVGNVQGKATTLNNLGHLKAIRGQIEQAIAFFEQSFTLSEQIGDIQGMAGALHNLGHIKANKGEMDEAIALFEQSLAIKEEISDLQATAMTLQSLGQIKANRGEIEEAIALYQQSLAIDEQIGDVQGQAAMLHEIGRLKANSGEIEEAIALYQQSLAITEQIGNVQGKAATLHQLGILKANSGEIEEAIALYQQSLALNEQIGNVQGQAMTLWWLAGMAEEQGSYNQALDYLQPALEILQRIQSPDADGVRQMVVRVQDLIRNS